MVEEARDIQEKIKRSKIVGERSLLHHFQDAELVHSTLRRIGESLFLSQARAGDVIPHDIKHRHGVCARLCVQWVAAELVNVLQDLGKLRFIALSLLRRQVEA